MITNSCPWYETIPITNWENMIMEHIKRELNLSQDEAEKKYKEMTSRGVFNEDCDLRTDCKGIDKNGSPYYSVRLGIIRVLSSMGCSLSGDI